MSGTPVAALKFGKAIAEAGADLFFVQATVVSAPNTSARKARKASTSKPSAAISACPRDHRQLRHLRRGHETHACRRRGRDGGHRPWCRLHLPGRARCIGIPQATARLPTVQRPATTTMKESGRYVPIVADGGIVTGGDICKCLACGADAVMIGSPIARSDGSSRTRLPLGDGHAQPGPSPRHPHQRGDHRKPGEASCADRPPSTTAPITCWAASRPRWAPWGLAPSRKCSRWRSFVAPSLLTEGQGLSEGPAPWAWASRADRVSLRGVCGPKPSHSSHPPARRDPSFHSFEGRAPVSASSLQLTSSSRAMLPKPKTRC